MIKDKPRKIFISEREMYINLVALCINRYPKSSSQFQKRLVAPVIEHSYDERERVTPLRNVKSPK